MFKLDYPFDYQYLSRKKKSIIKELLNQDGLIEKRIAILSGSTIDEIKAMLELFLLGHGIKPIFYIGHYNRYYEEIIYENKEILEFSPEIIYIHTTIRNYSDNEFDRLHQLWEKIKTDMNCIIIQNNFESPYYEYMDFSYRINDINNKIFAYAKQNEKFYVNDINRLSSLYGLDRWNDAQNWYLYKYAMSLDAIPDVAYNIAKIVKSILGKNQKCLVLDLDNTLWGGTVGDDNSIELGMETAKGEAYIEFQQYVKKLYEIGVILAVCSKNDEKTAKNAFDNPNMVLKLRDFSAFYANWDDKATNILRIAKDLNILPDSIVFLDDSPIEREFVRGRLPEVKVPDVVSVLDFIPALDRAGYFDVVNVSNDDLKRNEYYKSDSKRFESQSTFESYEDFLRSLRMVCKIKSFDFENAERITQLINKTNQFNLTTRRYTQAEIENTISNERYITLYASLSDKYGSNGIVSALIGEKRDGCLHIRLWVMSCRVFKRNLELAVFDTLADCCHKEGLKLIKGYYFPTSKNSFVANLYSELGFVSKTDEIWELDMQNGYEKKNKVIQVSVEVN